MKTWVDASYAVHKDMKRHTGGVISFGRGAIVSKSSKQKLNTKSSTEAELVGASDFLPSSIWTRMFLEEQGYKIIENTFYQDNQSAMKLEKNGRMSCGQKSRYIDIRYFFIKDRLLSENIKIEYCPTEQMIADFFTKPLQGQLFAKLREVVMGHKHISTLQEQPCVPTQERVGENVKTVEFGTHAETNKNQVNMSQRNVQTNMSQRNEIRGRKSYSEVVRSNLGRKNECKE